MRREVEFLQKLDHPNIVRLFHIYEDVEYLYLVMEHLCGCELYEHMLESGVLGEREAAYLLKRILLAVNVLHENGIAHRDVKPENFLFETHKMIELKLIDLGLSQRYRTSSGDLVGMKALVGTPIYNAPEILSEGDYGPKCDLWSIGVIMWRMLLGKNPFAGENLDELETNIVAGNIDHDEAAWAMLSAPSKDLLLHLLDSNPSTRYG